MKKTYFTLILLVSILSCKKEGAREDVDSETYNSKLRALTTDVGIVHNKTLNFFLKNSKTLIVDQKTTGWRLGNGSTISNNDSMPNQVLNLVNHLNFTENSYADLDPVAAQKLDVLMENLNLTSIEAAWNSEISAVTSENLLTFREANMVEELKDIFSDAYSLNLTQAAASTYFEDRLEQIRILYQNTIFEANEGELYFGSVKFSSVVKRILA